MVSLEFQLGSIKTGFLQELGNSRGAFTTPPRAWLSSVDFRHDYSCHGQRKA
jgi:hypothetical protein